MDSLTRRLLLRIAEVVIETLNEPAASQPELEGLSAPAHDQSLIEFMKDPLVPKAEAELDAVVIPAPVQWEDPTEDTMSRASFLVEGRIERLKDQGFTSTNFANFARYGGCDILTREQIEAILIPLLRAGRVSLHFTKGGGVNRVDFT